MSKLSYLLFLLNLYTAQLSEATKDIFQVKLGQLETLINTGQLETLSLVLANDGALAVTEFPVDYSQSVIQLQAKAPECLQQSQSPEFDLPDGSVRRTFGLESGGEMEYPECIRRESHSIHSHFTTLDGLMSSLVTRLAGDTSWSDTNTRTRGNFSAQMYKDHIHVYSKPQSVPNKARASKYAAPFHIDSGLLLFLTPFHQLPLLVKSRAGQLINTEQLRHDSVIVILASALPDWLLRGLQSSKSFFASPHAVPSLPASLSSRTVFARMKVVPDDAIPSGHRQTFSEFFSGQDISRQEDLCPVSDHYRQSALVKRWNNLASSQCSHSQAYCWMNCLEVPSCGQDQAVACLNSASSQCCTDSVTEDCANMDHSCSWECRNSSSPHLPHTQERSQSDERFCNGYGTDMFMQGFTASGNSRDSCVILLFHSWTLDTRTKFVIGCIGVILLGIGIEAMLCVRRKLQKRRILVRMSGVTRRAAIIFLFGVNIASGYFAMLVAMTYSVELFICMILGLVIGHGIFNTGAAVGESVDPCCASQEATNDAKHEEATKMSA